MFAAPPQAALPDRLNTKKLAGLGHAADTGISLPLLVVDSTPAVWSNSAPGKAGWFRAADAQKPSTSIACDKSIWQIDIVACIARGRLLGSAQFFAGSAMQ